ncbi:MAG: PQQ-dependent sugar dehydrogenase [Acetobacteraceae bacterium]|nr:PQQ-dependent sugar dehydrogenase [Acetobacteraceae bacterium]
MTVAVSIASALLTAAFAQTNPTTHNGIACRNDAGITLPPGFCATVFADKLGHVRHMVAAPDGVLYVNTWSGRYYGYGTLPPGGFLVALKDTKGDGRADVIQRFGETVAGGGHGGTGVGLYKDGLYAEINDRIVRYQLKSDEIAPTSPPTTIVSGLPLSGDHPMHPFAIDSAGNMYVDLGSATNACQKQNRIPHSPGIQPCTELETRAGTWRYDAKKTDQHFSPAERFVTGLRNGEGIAFDSQGRIFATQHGRDQLFENWPNLYAPNQGENLPAEELVSEHQGADFGWPECYFDNYQKQLVLAPEYGGDGGKEVGICAQKQGPVAFFPAHWAPNDLAIYYGTQFPNAYRGGAFIAFHGSWNRAPAPQQGYNVVFQPLADGKPSGAFVIFADGFAGKYKDPGRAAHRPTGLAVAPDGSLYISDDKAGTIWHVTYNGSRDAKIAAASAATGAESSAAAALPPEGIHPNAGNELAALQPPPGVTREQLARGEQIFKGQVDNGTCSGCHGMDAKGTPMGADLTSGKFLWGDGSLQSIAHTIRTGVEHPKERSGVMPPDGGASLSDADVTNVAAYVWALGHQQEANVAK